MEPTIFGMRNFDRLYESLVLTLEFAVVMFVTEVVYEQSAHRLVSRRRHIVHDPKMIAVIMFLAIFRAEIVMLDVSLLRTV